MLAVLAKRLEVRPPGIEEVLPRLADRSATSTRPEALADYQAKKRAHKAAMRAEQTADA